MVLNLRLWTSHIAGSAASGTMADPHLEGIARSSRTESSKGDAGTAILCRHEPRCHREYPVRARLVRSRRTTRHRSGRSGLAGGCAPGSVRRQANGMGHLRGIRCGLRCRGRAHPSAQLVSQVDSTVDLHRGRPRHWVPHRLAGRRPRRRWPRVHGSAGGGRRIGTDVRCLGCPSARATRRSPLAGHPAGSVGGVGARGPCSRALATVADLACRLARSDVGAGSDAHERCVAATAAPTRLDFLDRSSDCPIAPLVSGGQRNAWSSTCDGVLHPRVCRGRPLSSAAMASRPAWSCGSGLRFGKY